MTILDLFSGIGGFSLALKNIYKKEILHLNSDINKYANEVYKYHFNQSINYGSVTNIQSKKLPKIDIITFGSPCQDFSLAGKREGLDGQRSGLISEAIRLIKQCKPDFFIWENVKGTFSSNNRKDFTAILQAFTNIGGYRLEWQLLNTKWFLPQNRERIYLIGLLGKGSGQQVFPIGENNKQVNELQGQQANTCTLAAGRRDGQGSYIIERKLNAQEIKIKSATKKGYEIAKVGDAINYTNINSKTRRGRVGKGIAQTLDTGCNQGVLGYTRDSKGKVVKRHIINKANTIHSSSGGGGNTDQFIINQSKIRRLTPIECERLQGFPDNWTKYGINGLISDTQRYKMCGNAITVNVAEAIFKKIYGKKNN